MEYYIHMSGRNNIFVVKRSFLESSSDDDNDDESKTNNDNNINGIMKQKTETDSRPNKLHKHRFRSTTVMDNNMSNQSKNISKDIKKIEKEISNILSKYIHANKDDEMYQKLRCYYNKLLKINSDHVWGLYLKFCDLFNGLQSIKNNHHEYLRRTALALEAAMELDNITPNLPELKAFLGLYHHDKTNIHQMKRLTIKELVTTKWFKLFASGAGIKAVSWPGITLDISAEQITEKAWCCRKICEILQEWNAHHGTNEIIVLYKLIFAYRGTEMIKNCKKQYNNFKTKYDNLYMDLMIYFSDSAIELDSNGLAQYNGNKREINDIIRQYCWFIDIKIDSKKIVDMMKKIERELRKRKKDGTGYYSTKWDQVQRYLE